MTRTHGRDAPLSAFVEPCTPTLAIAAAPPRTVMNSRRRMTSISSIRRCVVRHSKFGRPSGSGSTPVKLRVSKTSPVWTLTADMAWISGQVANGPMPSKKSPKKCCGH
jgi:hypothetical protein